MKPMAYLCCDRVIIDQQQNPTLIAVIENLTVQLPPDAEVPSDVVAPREWWVFTMWMPEEDDIGKTFEQHLELESASGRVSRPEPLKFTVNNNEQAKNMQQIFGFPVGTEGHCSVRMWVQLGDAHVTDTFTYKITVKHQRQPNPVTA